MTSRVTLVKNYFIIKHIRIHSLFHAFAKKKNLKNHDLQFIHKLNIYIQQHVFFTSIKDEQKNFILNSRLHAIFCRSNNNCCNIKRTKKKHRNI